MKREFTFGQPVPAFTGGYLCPESVWRGIEDGPSSCSEVSSLIETGPDRGAVSLIEKDDEFFLVKWLRRSYQANAWKGEITAIHLLGEQVERALNIDRKTVGKTVLPRQTLKTRRLDIACRLDLSVKAARWKARFHNHREDQPWLIEYVFPTTYRKNQKEFYRFKNNRLNQRKGERSTETMDRIIQLKEGGNTVKLHLYGGEFEYKTKSIKTRVGSDVGELYLEDRRTGTYSTFIQNDRNLSLILKYLHLTDDQRHKLLVDLL